MALRNLAVSSLVIASIAGSASASVAPRQSINEQVGIEWSSVLLTSKTTTTLQVVGNGLLVVPSTILDNAYKSLALVSSNLVRLVPWYPYPHVAVPELDAPSTGAKCTTSWDFTYADILVDNFYTATPNVSHIINFSTIPGWMWTGAAPSYPSNVSEADFNYNGNSNTLRDSTFKEVSDYFARIVSWYTLGGFTDECGVKHTSQHHYTIEYWEVLNEIDEEHTMQPQYYNQVYDAIVTAILAVSPNTKFVGLALNSKGFNTINYVTTFLDSSKHKAGIPLDYISYHYYPLPKSSSTDSEATQCFDAAATFLDTISSVEAVRKRLSPSTKTTLDEVGTFNPKGLRSVSKTYVFPDQYWLWSGGFFAYVFAKIAVLGIDAIGESQLVGFPSQFPSVSMVDWTTGLPNARLRTLQLLVNNLAPGDLVIQTTTSNETAFHAQAFKTPSGAQKLLLVNKQQYNLNVAITGFENGNAQVVDLSTNGGDYRTAPIQGSTFNLSSYAIAILTA